MKKGYAVHLEKITAENADYRRVLYTAKNCQLVLMSIPPEEEIGMEMHGLDQFLRFESGKGAVVIDNTEYAVSDGYAVIVPAGSNHNVINTSKTEHLKLYTLYSPPEHRDGTVRATKEEADENEEHFDGQTTE